MTFKPTGFAAKIFSERHAFTLEETWEEAIKRVSSQVAKAEKGDKQKEVKEMFSDMLLANYFMPGGRIWYGAGKARPNLMNCFVIPCSDSREGWGKLVSDNIIISGLGGGIGTSFNPIRPKNAEIKGTGGTSSGSVSLMRIIDATASEIKGGGSRRAALMMSLRYDHPDIHEFLSSKLDLANLNNANISIEIDDKFIDAVENDEEIVMEFGEKAHSSYRARDLFNKVMDNAIKNGEPGFLNLGLANKMNNLYYIAPIISTNPCGELPMAAYQSCCLGSLVLTRFVRSNGEFDFQKLADVIPVAVRFLDNVLDVNYYPLKEIEVETKKFRRIGLGVMGLHDMLLKMGLKYTSEEGHKFVDKLMNFIKKKSYESSTYLAVEKGSFAGLNRDLYLKGNFIKTLSPSIKTKISQYGIRNCALGTIAPTGTTGIVSGVSGGIEPLFSYAYRRRYFQGEGENTEVVIHPLFEEFVNENKDVSHFETAHEIKPEDHIKMQVVCQKHVDGAISKSVNLPKDFTAEDMKPILLKYIRELKGITVYRDGSRGESPMTPMSIEDAKKWVKKEHVTASKEKDCAGGKCNL